MDVNATLAERGSRYGDFRGHAVITQGLKGVMQKSPKWDVLNPSQKEALEMIAHKIGRVLNGDPNYVDSWHDIIGYAKLVEDELTGAGEPTPAAPAVAAPVAPAAPASPRPAFVSGVPVPPPSIPVPPPSTPVGDLSANAPLSDAQ